MTRMHIIGGGQARGAKVQLNLQNLYENYFIILDFFSTLSSTSGEPFVNFFEHFR